jgi:hypothetical protein
VYIFLPSLAIFVSYVSFKVFQQLVNGFAEASEKKKVKKAEENKQILKMRRVLYFFVSTIFLYFGLNIMNGIFAQMNSPNVGLIIAFTNSVMCAQYAVFAYLVYLCTNGIQSASRHTSSLATSRVTNDE